MYRRILVAIDNSHGTPYVLDEALKLAGLHPAELHLVTVVNLLELAVEDPASTIRRNWPRWPISMATPCWPRPNNTPASMPARCTPACGTAGKAAGHCPRPAQACPRHPCRPDHHGHPRRRGLRHALMGSVAEYVMRKATCRCWWCTRVTDIWQKTLLCLWNPTLQSVKT